jgi:uncharacterized protein (UPF0305 family)
MASEEMIQAINKHLMGDAEEFIELRERFEGCDSFQPHAAAALGYLIAKDELEAAKEEEEEPDVYDEVVEIIKKYCKPPGPNSTHTAADEIFTLIYEWLDGELARPGSVAFPGHTRNKIDELFSLFVIKQPEA